MIFLSFILDFYNLYKKKVAMKFYSYTNKYRCEKRTYVVANEFDAEKSSYA